ncbi:M15 family metallopeptidase [Spirilliplanes yamanashiensis]|uniref:M15 family metallopeptidase n=1 Tax=Spirilliplanes yamanashiensis TaxID=42233 RepID=UPI001EF2C6D0|nr:M15 family metallopeptidase [Spirilliplanes yamanashiensis]MDP9816729.1 LAS superfamily LD-carboxypeptidase LdcB [Spirilliplanes yamanashiensis]
MTARMAEIQTRMVALATGNAVGSTTATSSSSSAATATTKTSGTAFASALADAVAATDGTAATAGAKKAGGSHTVNSKGVPTELAAYGNGKIPANALEKVAGTNHKLWAPAAQSLTNMLAAAKRDGVTIGITDSYRSYDEQVDVARRKGLYSQGGLAAKPGTSDHGWGMAVDLDLNSKAQAWMRKHGKEYGFEEDTPREPWHWGFKP